MIKEADFLRPISHGKSAFLLLHYGFTVDTYRNPIDYQLIIFKKTVSFQIIHKNVDKCTENPLNNFLITCGISTSPPPQHPRLWISTELLISF